MISSAPGIENLTLNLIQEIHVHAPLDVTFAALLEQIGPANDTPDGKPMAHAIVVCNTSEKHYSGLDYESFPWVQPDKSGRFSIEGLAPGLKYELVVVQRPRELEIVGGKPKELTIRSGETKDLGDLTVKPME